MELRESKLRRDWQADAKEMAQMCTGYIHGSKRRVVSMGGHDYATVSMAAAIKP